MSSARANVRALALGVGLALAGLLVAELAWRLFVHEPQGLAWDYPAGYKTTDSADTVAGRPGRNRVRLTDTQTGEVVYDVIYTLDASGRRETPATAGASPGSAILFFGGSFIFGEGVADDEALPAQVAALVPGRRVYNYGFHGVGPFDALAKLEVLDFARDVPEPVSDVLYLFIDTHMRRLVCTSAIASWKKDGAYYRRGPLGARERDGSFASARPLRTLLVRLLGGSALLADLGVELPDCWAPRALETATRAIAQMRDTAARRFPGSRFSLVLYPGSLFGRRIAAALADSGVPVLDYVDLFDRSDPRFQIGEKERHPSPAAYRALARQLVLDLWGAPSPRALDPRLSPARSSESAPPTRSGSSAHP